MLAWLVQTPGSPRLALPSPAPRKPETPFPLPRGRKLDPQTPPHLLGRADALGCGRRTASGDAALSPESRGAWSLPTAPTPPACCQSGSTGLSGTCSRALQMSLAGSGAPRSPGPCREMRTEARTNGLPPSLEISRLDDEDISSRDTSVCREPSGDNLLLPVTADDSLHSSTSPSPTDLPTQPGHSRKTRF